MSDFISNLPVVILRKLYGNLGNFDKINFSKALKGEQQWQIYDFPSGPHFSPILNNAGCYNYKEELSCPICQMHVFYDEITSSANESQLGFHLVHTRYGVSGPRPKYRLRGSRFGRESIERDEREAGHVLTSLYDALAAVFKSRSLHTLFLHIMTEHERSDGWLPKNYVHLRNRKIRRLQAMTNNGYEGGPSTLREWQDKLDGQKNAFRQIIGLTIGNFRYLHSFGGKFPTIRLMFDGREDILPQTTAISCFYTLLETLVNQDPTPKFSHVEPLGLNFLPNLFKISIFF